ncbi:MAG: GIY-YIG nuclease family protein [Coriobacteriales bacterium]|jgi:putative endonuclease|nr:GIY-YIG nuclease family protein [Coriobacteriales bacterium]
MSKYYTYILANKRNGTIYTGVTNDLIRRVHEHKRGLNDSFTKKYKVHKLVWYASFESISEAIYMEKRIKNWKREWKTELITQYNPNWNDLYNTLEKDEF